MTEQRKINPWTEVADFNSLCIAHKVFEKNPFRFRFYWETIKDPINPLGRLKYESARMAATFVVPLLGLAVAGISAGTKGMLFGLPVAIAVGAMLHWNYTRAVDKKRKRDEYVDCGRFFATAVFCDRFGLKPEEVTLELITKMERDYRREVHARALREQAEREAEARSRANIQEAIAMIRAGSNAFTSGNRKGAAGEAAAGAAFAHDVDEDGVITSLPQTPFSSMDVNPATGLPMLGGTHIDAGGNTFGSDNFGTNH